LKLTLVEQYSMEILSSNFGRPIFIIIQLALKGTITPFRGPNPTVTSNSKFY